MIPSPLTLELASALCIACSGAPGLLRRSGALGQSIATGLNGAGSALGLAGLYLHARSGEPETAFLGLLPVGSVSFALDALSALFLIPILVISALGSIYGSSYWRQCEHPTNGRGLRLWWGIMTASMMVVVLADDAVLFLAAWEAMALAAFFLICTEDEQPEVRRASWIYLVATHAGTLCLIAFFVLLDHAHGSFSLWPRLPDEAPSWLSTALFALGITGFGFKAGLIPFHVWLPGAHANTPSHVSAFLSGVLLKVGIYGVLRVCGLLAAPPAWWGGVLIGLGVVSGVLGIALAMAQQDVKRLLAYSSIENIGIIVIGVGLASLGRSLGLTELVILGLGGALLHVLSHSLMKPLLFLSAGSLLHATGTRQISALGGLGRTMPKTFALFAVGALAICGLPPLNGFVSELFLAVALLRAAVLDGASDWAWVALAAPALGLIGALAAAAFVKVMGIAFGGTARTPRAACAHDPGLGMLAPMFALASGCILIGLVPHAAIALIRGSLMSWDPRHTAATPPLEALVSPNWISGGGVLLIAGTVLIAAALRRRLSRQPTVVTWDCGYAAPTSRMQYVDSSFSETLVGLFRWALRSRQTPVKLAGPFPAVTRFETAVPDAVLDRIVLPLLRGADRGVSRLRVLQRGPVQMYLLYVLFAVVALLVVAR